MYYSSIVDPGQSHALIRHYSLVQRTSSVSFVRRMDNVEGTCQVDDIEHVAVRGQIAEASQGGSRRIRTSKDNAVVRKGRSGC
jgi:hypothetical protein